MAYRVLSGMLPFATENPTQMLVMKKNYPPPSLRDRTGTPWPEPLEAFLREMIAVRPEARPPSADHALAAWRDAARASAAAVERQPMLREAVDDRSRQDPFEAIAAGGTARAAATPTSDSTPPRSEETTPDREPDDTVQDHAETPVLPRRR
jgi:hypothetical protein